ncbi:NAD(P)H-dependent flavin oxidoreductase [Pokkaliibacter sp. CJK22405]|uniref:NAD(P)H-dependent flavin oxidoreductase n=1 Tax=Pokkaliibacter sp. CJK22405 TaxID=3384615 RepID=UPI0039855D9C
MSTDFLHALKLRYPLLQAPMAGVSTPDLAAAVSNAGGMGALGIGAMNAAQAREVIKRTQALTHYPININVFCHKTPTANPERESRWLQKMANWFTELGEPVPEILSSPYLSFNDDEAMQNLLLELRPAVVSFHFGLPERTLVKRYHQAGIRLVATATNLAEADAIAAAGLDAIIAQGMEAGGHRGVFYPELGDAQISTLALTRRLRSRTSLPIIAAGGIMDGAAIKAALAAGASAVQMGTAFLLCPEAGISSAYRHAIHEAEAEDTAITTAISGRAARGIRNKLYRSVHRGSEPDYPIAYDAAKQLHKLAAAKGIHDYAAHWAGQGVGLAREMPACLLVETLAKEAGW